MAWREMTHSRSADKFELMLGDQEHPEFVDENGVRVVEVDGKRWWQRGDGTWFTTRLVEFPDET